MRIQYIFIGITMLHSAYKHYVKEFEYWGTHIPEEGCYALALGGIYFLLCGFNVIMKSNEEPEEVEYSADTAPDNDRQPEKKK
ncbi:MAG: hypothetical protein ACNI27_15185 [Desulfovibrio sp.]